MKIILISLLISFIAGVSYAATLPQTIKIENKNLTQIEYNSLKNSLIDDYKAKGFFTVNQWQTYVQVLKKEAKDGILKNIRITSNIHKDLMDKIYVK